MCDSFCAETIHFMYFVQFDLLELQRFCFLLSSHGVLYIEGVKTAFRFWSFLIIFTKTKQLWTENSKMTGLKDCQENVSLSLAKGKLDEKNEWKFSNQSGDLMYASIYLTNRRKCFFFFGSLFRV